MSIDHLLNHTASIYRDVPTRGGFGSTSVWTLMQADVKARADIDWSGTQQEAGGEMQGSRRRWFLPADAVVAERDVLDVTSGPEAPQKVRVLSVVKAGGMSTHHIEVNVETFIGSLS